MSNFKDFLEQSQSDIKKVNKGEELLHVVPDIAFGYSQSSEVKGLPGDFNRPMDISYYATFCIVDLVNKKAYQILSYERPNTNSAKEEIGLRRFKDGFKAVFECSKSVREAARDLIDNYFPEMDKEEEILKSEFDLRFLSLLQDIQLKASQDIKNISTQTGAFDNFRLVEIPFIVAHELSEMPGLSFMLDRQTRIEARNRRAALRDAKRNSKGFKVFKPD